MNLESLVHAVRSISCALAVLTLVGSSLRAADRVETGTVLAVDVARGVIAQAPQGSETALGDSNTFTMRRNETVRIDIARHNPLLFTYEAASVKSDTAEYAAALEFAKQLQALLALFPESKGSGVRKRTVRQIDLDQLREDLEAVRELFTSLSGDLAASLGTAPQVESLKKKYAEKDVEALAKRIEAATIAISSLVSTCEQPEAALVTDDGQAISCELPLALGTNVELTGQLAAYRAKQREVEQIGTERNQAAGDLVAARSDLEAAKKAKKKEDVAAKTAAIAQLETLVAGLDSVKRARQLEAETMRAELEKERSNPALHPTLIEFARRVEATAALVLRQLDTLRAVNSDVAALGASRTVITVPYSLQRQTVTVSIGAQSKYDRYLEPETRRRRDSQVRKLVLVLEPYQPVRLSLAPAFVLGFLRNPEFTAVKDGDAFKIQKKDSELTRYTAAVMLNLTPHAWQEPAFGGHFQLGISPVKDSLGFFFGAGIRAQSLFTFGGGLMIQQVRRLGDGLTLESRLDDPAKLKVDREFKRGLYLHVTVSIPK